MLRRVHPLNLSISVSGGKESKSDSLSSGERTERSPAHNLPGYQAGGGILRKESINQSLALPSYGEPEFPYEKSFGAYTQAVTSLGELSSESY